MNVTAHEVAMAVVTEWWEGAYTHEEFLEDVAMVEAKVEVALAMARRLALEEAEHACRPPGPTCGCRLAVHAITRWDGYTPFGEER